MHTLRLLLPALLLALPLQATPPGYPGTPPTTINQVSWFGSHRDLVRDVQARFSPLLAPGVNLQFAGSRPDDPPARVPIFLVMLQDTPEKEKLVNHTREALFGPRGLQPYLNHVMTGMRQFLDPADLIPITLPRTWDVYLAGSSPREEMTGVWPLFDDISTALTQENRSLLKDHYIAKNSRGERLGRGSGVPQPDADTVDGCILILACPPNQVYAYRDWFRRNTSLPILRTAAGHSFKLDSYIALSAYVHLPSLDPAPPAGTPFYPGYLHHEFLHIFRVPDTYDRDNNTSGCGCWCSMSYGMFGGRDNRETVPVWPGAWVRRFLNPLSEITAERSPSPTTVQLTHALSSQEGKKILKLPILTPESGGTGSSTRQYERYLLVELRGAARPGETFLWDEPDCPRSFLVWDVDESVGRVPGSSPDNETWPFGDSGTQNDNEHKPLVALIPRQYLSQDNSPLIERRNLRSHEDVRHFSEIGTRRSTDAPLRYMNWTLSHWDPANGIVRIQYTPDPVLAGTGAAASAPGSPSPASPPPGGMSAPGAPPPGDDKPVPRSVPTPVPAPLAPPPATDVGSVTATATATATAPADAAPAPAGAAPSDTAKALDIITVAGSVSEVSKQLPPEVNQRLTKLYDYFPNNQQITLDPAAGSLDITTTVAAKSSQARKSLPGQISAVRRALGNQVSHLRAKTSSLSSQALSLDKAVSRLVDQQKNVVFEPYITLEGQSLLVTGAPVTAETGTTASPAAPDTAHTFRFHIPSVIDVPQERIQAITTALRENKYLKETDIREYLDKLQFKLPADVNWELTVENKTGRFLWQCTLEDPGSPKRTLSIPALGTLGPDTVITIE